MKEGVTLGRHHMRMDTKGQRNLPGQNLERDYTHAHPLQSHPMSLFLDLNAAHAPRCSFQRGGQSRQKNMRGFRTRPRSANMLLQGTSQMSRLTAMLS